MSILSWNATPCLLRALILSWICTTAYCLDYWPVNECAGMAIPAPDLRSGWHTISSGLLVNSECGRTRLHPRYEHKQAFAQRCFSLNLFFYGFDKSAKFQLQGTQLCASPLNAIWTIWSKGLHFVTQRTLLCLPTDFHTVNYYYYRWLFTSAWSVCK